MATAAEQKKQSNPASDGNFTAVEFTLWFLGAIVADIFSLIPYLGVIVSWPFAAFFLLFKWMKKLNFSKTVLVSVGDFLAEGIFSSLPANTADVVITYFMSKAAKITGGLSGVIKKI